MYQPLPTDVSGRNYQEEMRDMLRVMLPAYELAYKTDDDGDLDKEGEIQKKGPALVKEFNDMLEFAGSTVTGVEDRAVAVIEYLEHHYCGGPMPQWYANLCNGS